ncbi:eukaryotic translation initiation factor 2 subunit alpha-like protein [Senna tora]|uniref:Eukaryotic translation initiation factor 2 subunit alpha-like protein n=1 Tax=Senna tora TaxID=362788 RepID=A0A834T7I0_9FABA|nr:eukaryotic translation initiation factor 2 subunit alpha-like protein [Senna tora]
MAPNLECRMYEAKYPEVGMAVMIQLKSISETSAYVSLLEYDNIEGMILFSELSRRLIRGVRSIIKVSHPEPVMVLRVDEDKGYIDLSKRRVTEEDIEACVERYDKSKLVHSIMRHVAEAMDIDLEELYIHIGWPLYRKYGHAFEAFKIIVRDPDSVLNSLTREVKDPDGKEATKVVPAVSGELKKALVKNIQRRMTPQPVKIRADIEMKCFHFDGVLHIKEAMRRAEAAGNNDCPVKFKLVAPPLYVLTTQTLDKEQGILVLNNAIIACTEAIEQHKGQLAVKEAPSAVSIHEALKSRRHMEHRERHFDSTEDNQMFYQDTKHWSQLVSDVYADGLSINWPSVRNVMDMNAGYGGFLFKNLEKRYDHGMFFYLILFYITSISFKCDIVDVVAEVDRILRPDGYLVVQDSLEVISKLSPILLSLNWSVTLHQNQFLVSQKSFWRP